MRARLFVQEAGSQRFEVHNGEFEDDVLNPDEPDKDLVDGYAKAYTEGLRLAREGNVQAFQIWTLSESFVREWAVKGVPNV